jgi:hypothetical protein
MGYVETTLSTSNITLTANTDFKDQAFSGTPTVPITITASLSGSPQVGQSFFIHFVGLVITPGITITLLSGLTTILTLSDPGTWTGSVRLIKSSSGWRAHQLGLQSSKES